MPFSIKQLFVIVPDYPHGQGEPFFQSELKQLASFIPHIYVINRHDLKSLKSDFHEAGIPENVVILNAGFRLSLLDKVAGTCRALLFHKGWMLSDLKSNKKLFSLLAWKTAMMYEIRAFALQKRIRTLMLEKGIRDEGGVWYSYWTDEAAYLLAAWRRKGIIGRAISRAHGADVYAERHPGNYLPFREFIHSNLDVVVAISYHGRRYLINRYLRNASKFKMSRLGISVQPRNEFERGAIIRILTLSSIVQVKNLECLINALKGWAGCKLEWHHIGTGRGDAYSKNLVREIMATFSTHEWVSVTFHGWVPPFNVLESVHKIAPLVLVNTSKYEGIPVSMMEASSLGIPIIGSNICGVPEIVSEGVNGFLIDGESPQSVREGIRKMVELSDEEYALFSDAARRQQRVYFNEAINYTHFRNLLEGGDVISSVEANLPLTDIQDFVPSSGVGLLNIGIGNIESIRKMLRNCGIKSDTVMFAEDIGLFHTIILPGVGSYDSAMQKLNERNLVQALKNHVSNGGRLIGICLGMQLLFEQSEEGNESGLGFIKGKVKRFPESIEEMGYKIPHMGWTTAKANRGLSEFADYADGEFYFTHSYYCEPDDESTVLYESHHGITFCSGVKQGSVLGFQFHPEKSLKHGKSLFNALFNTNLVAE